LLIFSFLFELHIILEAGYWIFLIFCEIVIVVINVLGKF